CARRPALGHPGHHAGDRVEIFRLPHDDLHRGPAIDPERGDRGRAPRWRQEVADRPLHQDSDDPVGHRHLGLLRHHRRTAALRPHHPAHQWRSAQLEPHHRDLPLPVRHPAHEARLRRGGERHAVHCLRDRGDRLSAHPVSIGECMMATRSKIRRPIISPFQWVTLLVIAAFIVVPFYTTALGGFKEIGELRVNPFGLPASWDPVRFTEILFGPTYLRSLGNSLFIAVGTVVLSTLVASMAAFAFAHIRFFGSKFLMSYLLLGLLFPAATAILPLF